MRAVTDASPPADGARPSASPLHLAAGQNLLAWRRTALQVAALGIVAARLLTERLGAGVIVASVLCVLMAAVVHASAGRAYGRATGGVGSVGPRGQAGVAHPQVRLAVLAGLTALVGVGALVWILRGGL